MKESIGSGSLGRRDAVSQAQELKSYVSERSWWNKSSKFQYMFYTDGWSLSDLFIYSESLISYPLAYITPKML